MKPEARRPRGGRENRQEKKNSPRLAQPSLHVPRWVHHRHVDRRHGDLMKLPPPQRCRSRIQRRLSESLIAVIRMWAAKAGEIGLEPLEVRHEVLRRLVTIVWIFAQAGRHDSI